MSLNQPRNEAQRREQGERVEGKVMHPHTKLYKAMKSRQTTRTPSIWFINKERDSQPGSIVIVLIE